MTWAVARIDVETEDSPWGYFARVLGYDELHEQAFLTSVGVRWAFVFRDEGEWNRGGKMILGTACMPSVTGALSGLFEQLLGDAVGYWPDFLITLNGAYWEQATDLEREILVFHELKHCGQAKDQYGNPKFRKSDGGPVLSMVAHDVEEFSDVVARYGAWKGDLRDFLDAAARGPKKPNSKVRPAPDLAAIAERAEEMIRTGEMFDAVCRPTLRVIHGGLSEPDLAPEELEAALHVEPRDDLPQSDESEDVF